MEMHSTSSPLERGKKNIAVARGAVIVSHESHPGRKESRLSSYQSSAAQSAYMFATVPTLAVNSLCCSLIYRSSDRSPGVAAVSRCSLSFQSSSPGDVETLTFSRFANVYLEPQRATAPGNRPLSRSGVASRLPKLSLRRVETSGSFRTIVCRPQRGQRTSVVTSRWKSP